MHSTPSKIQYLPLLDLVLPATNPSPSLVSKTRGSHSMERSPAQPLRIYPLT